MSADSSKQDAGFRTLGLGPKLLAILEELGYEEPTPIQRDAIPPLLAGRDVIGQAATGTGKTAAFALPLLQRLFDDGKRGAEPALLVLVPTRELAMQVAEAVHRYGRKLGVRVLPIYGGQSLGVQLRALERGVDVIVATPGRALDHVRRGTLTLKAARAVVLDEADEMLDMGFAEELEALLKELPDGRQGALFSATMPKHIVQLGTRHLSDPVRIEIPHEKLAHGAVPRVRQLAFVVAPAQKIEALGRILDLESPASALVFCRTRIEVEELAEKLNGLGYRAERLHGGISQDQRERVMRRFREGAAELLLATDVAARGLDIGRLSHVINFDVPSDPLAYVHRIGRTGRAGREGTAITLVEPRERPLLRRIEQLTKRRLDVAPVPTVADLRTRRLEITQAALREILAGGTAHEARAVVEALSREFDLFDVAAAAVKLAHDSSQRPPEAASAGPGAGPSARSSGVREGRARASGGEFARIFVSVGRAAGVRPGDLVGAITAEAGVEGSAVGAIEIAEFHSVVEVQEDRVDDILQALRSTTIRGRRITARRERSPGNGRSSKSSARRPATRSGARPTRH